MDRKEPGSLTDFRLNSLVDGAAQGPAGVKQLLEPVELTLAVAGYKEVDSWRQVSCFHPGHEVLPSTISV